MGFFNLKNLDLGSALKGRRKNTHSPIDTNRSVYARKSSSALRHIEDTGYDIRFFIGKNFFRLVQILNQLYKFYGFLQDEATRLKFGTADAEFDE